MVEQDCCPNPVSPLLTGNREVGVTACVCVLFGRDGLCEVPQFESVVL